MNNVCLIGRLTADPEVRHGGKDGDLEIVNFTLAVQRIGTEDADFIRCTAFGKTAEFAEDYFSKGLRIGVTGHIQTGSYERQDGSTAYTTDVIIDRLDFADGKKDESPQEQNKDARTTSRERNNRRR